MLFEGKVAVVTGAGGGIGKAIARRSAAEGAVLVLADAHAKSAEDTASDLPAATQRSVVVGNLREKAFCQALIDHAVHRHGRIAEPEDIADVIAFLASDQSRYVAGTTLEVNGAKPVY